MTAEDKKKVAVDFLRLTGQGHPREMQGVLKAGGIHHNVYVQRGWDALLTAMEEAGKKPPKPSPRCAFSSKLLAAANRAVEFGPRVVSRSRPQARRLEVRPRRALR